MHKSAIFQNILPKSIPSSCVTVAIWECVWPTFKMHSLQK